jgi:hypothetical protein
VVRRRQTAVALAALAVLLFVPAAQAGINLNLNTAPGSITMTPSGNNYITSFGTMNGLGIGTPSAGVTVIPLSNGALYYSTFQMTVTGGMAGTHHAYVTAYISTNFAHTAALTLEGCPSSSSCNTSGSFSALSTNVGAPTSVVATPGMLKSQTTTAGLAIFVPENNGAGAWSGADTAAITLRAYDFENGTQIDTVVLSLNNPNETLQTAVRLNLATATGGVTISPASDYSLGFGNVNALGIGPGAGLVTVSASGGIVYATPYNLLPVFSGINTLTCSISVHVSTDFVHPVVLKLQDSSASGGPYSAISKNAGAPTSITTTAANRSTTTRYLGLFVSNINGASAFTGADSATLTYTLTVP